MLWYNLKNIYIKNRTVLIKKTLLVLDVNILQYFIKYKSIILYFIKLVLWYYISEIALFIYRWFKIVQICARTIYRLTGSVL